LETTVRNALSRHVIGEETLQGLEVIPAQYRVMVTRRPNYACRACEQVVVQIRASQSHIEKLRGRSLYSHGDGALSSPS
jgi:transposase